MRASSRYRDGCVRHWSIVGALTASTVLLGCGGPQMAAPDDFHDGRVTLETDGRRGDETEGEEAAFSFGPYRVNNIRRDMTIDEGFENLEDFEPAAKRGFRYKLEGGGKARLDGRCSERAPQRERSLDGKVTVKQEAYPPLACTCEESGTPVAELFVEDLAGEYNGPLLIGGVEARVVGVYELENGDMRKGNPAGFLVRDHDGTVAAAGVLPGESRVLLRKHLEEPDRRLIVCGLVGLMLWVPPPVPEPEDD